MFILHAEKNVLAVCKGEPMTSGSVNTYEAAFTFSKEWAGLNVYAVFRAGLNGMPRSAPWAKEAARKSRKRKSVCRIPWEVMTAAGVRIYAGVYGTCGADFVLPTIWAELGVVLFGAEPGEDAQPPTPTLWEQELARKGDGLGYTEEGELGLYSGPRLLSSVAVQGGGAASRFGHGLKVAADGVVSVNAVSGFDGDNTLPITAAAVQGSIGNIEALLGTI